MSAVIHLSDPEHGLSYCGEPVTAIEAEGDTRPICQACHRGITRRLRRMVDEYRNEAVDLRHLLGLRTEALNRTVAQLDDLRAGVKRLADRLEPHARTMQRMGEIEVSVPLLAAVEGLRALLPDTPTTDERSTT